MVGNNLVKWIKERQRSMIPCTSNMIIYLIPCTSNTSIYQLIKVTLTRRYSKSRSMQPNLKNCSHAQAEINAWFTGKWSAGKDNGWMQVNGSSSSMKTCINCINWPAYLPVYFIFMCIYRSQNAHIRKLYSVYNMQNINIWKVHLW